MSPWKSVCALTRLTRDDRVGVRDVRVEVGHRTVGQPAELDGLHRRLDGHADALLGDAEAGQQPDSPPR
jgi:hypothetical protein